MTDEEKAKQLKQLEEEDKKQKALDILLSSFVDGEDADQVADKYGRPTVMTKSVLHKLRAAFLIGCTDEEACAYAEIGTTAFYNFQKRHPDFAELKNEFKNNPILKARQTVFDGLSEKPTAQWFLERKKKSEFATRSETLSLTPDDIKDELDKLESTNYDDVAREAQKQMVAINPPVQDQGQGGEPQDVQPEHNAAEASS